MVAWIKIARRRPRVDQGITRAATASRVFRQYNQYNRGLLRLLQTIIAGTRHATSGSSTGF